MCLGVCKDIGSHLLVVGNGIKCILTSVPSLEATESWAKLLTVTLEIE